MQIPQKQISNPTKTFSHNVKRLHVGSFVAVSSGVIVNCNRSTFPNGSPRKYAHIVTKMDLESNQFTNISRLLCFLESVLVSTQQTKISIEAYSNEAHMLLHGWVLPEDVGMDDAVCQCAQFQKQQLAVFLDKVEKAVKYSQSIREGRSDITSPWPEDVENKSSIADAKKLNLSKGPLQQVSLTSSREKFSKNRYFNGPLKKSSANISGKPNTPVCKEEDVASPVCPLHGSSANSIKTRKLPTVGLAEALDVKGIPPELVTVLKSVHLYINRLRTTNSKNRAESSFLQHLDSLNKTRWDKFALCTLLNKHAAVSSRASFGKIPLLEGGSDNELETDSFDPCIGIWNPAVSNLIPVDALCVQYQNEEIWNLLQMRMQQLQLSQAEWQVCDILSSDPLLSKTDVQHPAAPLFLKAASALSRLLVLNLPALVKTCR